MKRFALAMVVVLGCMAVPPKSAEAQELEVEGPLAGAPAVIGMRIYRDMRLQVQLHTTMTLLDEYSRAILAGGQLQFHLTDWLGIGVWGGYSVANLDTSLAEQVKEKGQSTDSNVPSLPDSSQFLNQIGEIKWMAAPQITFVPLRGKMGMFESVFVDTDLYIFAGLGIVGLQERVEVNESAGCLNRMNDLASRKQACSVTQDVADRVAMTATFGVGMSMYMADWAALTLEWRGMPFAWNTSGSDEACSSEGETVNGLDCRGDFPDGAVNEDDRLPHFNNMFTLGFAFFLPTEAKRSFASAE